MGSRISYLFIPIILITALLILSTAPYGLSQVNNSGWKLLGADIDEGVLFDLKAVYYKIEDNILYLKIVFYRPVYSLWDFDIHIFLDVDDDVSTGFYLAHADIGADYVIYIGNDVPVRYRYLSSFSVRYIGQTWDYSNPIFPDYEECLFPTDTIIVGYNLSKFEGLGDRLKIVFIDTTNYPVYDWLPNTGSFVIELAPKELIHATGICNGGLATLSLKKDSGTLKIIFYPGLQTKLSCQYAIKIMATVKKGSYLFMDIQINYNIAGHDNWLPAKIIVDYNNNKIYLIGPISMIGRF